MHVATEENKYIGAIYLDVRKEYIYMINSYIIYDKQETKQYV